MPDWKNYEPIQNRHELTIPNGPEIMLYDYKSGYRVQIKYEQHLPPNSPTVSISTEAMYAADDLEQAKEYAAMLAKTMFQKAVNQLKVAQNHTEFYTQDTEPEKPHPFDGIDPDSILWTDHVVTNKAIRDRTAMHLLETNLPTRQQIIHEIKRPTTERRHEIFSVLHQHECQGYCMVSITKTVHKVTKAETYFNQIEDDPTLGDVMTWISNIPDDTTVIYFQDRDVHVQQETGSCLSHTVLRLAEIKPNPNFKARIDNATLETLSDIDDMTVKLEDMIKEALEE